jgi:hypothetical protein
MCFVFQDDEPVAVDDPNTITCPGCRAPSDNSNVTDIQCKTCSMWFRRITVVEDVEPPPHVPLPQPWKLKPEFGKSNLSVQLSKP